MRVWVDVFNSDYQRQGDGPITSLISASFTRRLDGAGTFNLTASAADSKAISLLENEKRVRIYADNLSGGNRLLGEGIIRSRRLVEQPGGVNLSISGVDTLDELKRVNTLLARKYNDTVQNVADDLISLATGWTVEVDEGIASNIIDARFDGVSVLSALQSIAERYGYHMRLSSTQPRTVEVSTFGESNGLRISKVETVTSETVLNSELLMVQQITQGRQTEKIHNWILPIGSGEGSGALTLEKSTRTTPYTIETATGADGRDIYYLKDDDSVDAHGVIQKVVQFKEIAPRDNSDASIVSASNALYDATAEYLANNSVAQETYKVRVKNAQTTILPGDKIHVDYKAGVDTIDGFINYLSVRDDFYILDVSETVGASGSTSSLVISNVKSREKTPAETIVDAIEKIELKNIQPVTTASIRSYVYDREIDSTYSASVPLEITDATLYLQRARLRLKTSPFRSTATGASSGGASTETSEGGGNHSHTVTIPDHQHQMFDYAGGYPPGNYSTRLWFARDSESTSIASRYDVYLDGASDLSGNPLTTEIWTYGAGGGSTETSNDSGTHTHAVNIPAHTHNLEYGITEDDQYPEDVIVKINGVDKTTELFGSSTLSPTGLAIDAVADSETLTDLLINASGGLRQEHNIGIECSSGQGRVEVTVEVYEITQTVVIE